MGSQTNPFPVPVLRQEGHFDVHSRTPSGIHIDHNMDHQFFSVSRAHRCYPLPEVDIETGNDVTMTSSRPEVTGNRPEVVGDNRETTPEMTSYRSKTFADRP